MVSVKSTRENQSTQLYNELLNKGQEVETRLKMLGSLSHTEGVPGIWRAVHTEADRRGKSLLTGFMEEAGLTVHEDPFGNLFGRLEGEVKETVLVGSHVDTVKDGGLYDGACGVVSAISAVKALRKAGLKPHYSIEVVGIEEEEGSRFDLSYPGSHAIIGGLPLSALEIRDDEGNVLREVMEQGGYDWRNIAGADRRGDVIEFIELHVEQGAVLDREQISIGLVENITGMVQFTVTITGEQNHAGATPMYMRKDPMVRAAALMLRLTEEVKAISQTGVITFGEVEVHPGVSNVIPGRVTFSIDLRDGNGASLLQEEETVKRCAAEAESEGFGVEVVMYSHEDPVPLNQDMIGSLEDACREAGFTYKRMNSGAGHDSMVIGREIPTCMIFVPSKGGISHSPQEYTSPEDLGRGVEVLGRLLVKRAHAYKR